MGWLRSAWRRKSLFWTWWMRTFRFGHKFFSRKLQNLCETWTFSHPWVESGVYIWFRWQCTCWAGQFCLRGKRWRRYLKIWYIFCNSWWWGWFINICFLKIYKRQTFFPGERSTLHPKSHLFLALATSKMGTIQFDCTVSQAHPLSFILHLLSSYRKAQSWLLSLLLVLSAYFSSPIISASHWKTL